MIQKGPLGKTLVPCTVPLPILLFNDSFCIWFFWWSLPQFKLGCPRAPQSVSWTSSVGITWKLVRNANPCSLGSRPTESEALGRVQPSEFLAAFQGVLHANIWGSLSYVTFFLAFYFEIISNLQKGCTNNTKDACTPFTWIFQVHICFHWPPLTNAPHPPHCFSLSLIFVNHLGLGCILSYIVTGTRFSKLDAESGLSLNHIPVWAIVPIVSFRAIFFFLVQGPIQGHILHRAVVTSLNRSSAFVVCDLHKLEESAQLLYRMSLRLDVSVFPCG